MSEFKQFDDLENHFIKVTAIVNNFEKFQQSQQNYAIVIEKLNEDVGNLRESNKTLNQLLSSTSKSEEENRVHSLYVNLKEKYNQLERSYFKIEKKNLFIEQNHMLNVIQLEENFEREKERINSENLKKIQFLEAKLGEERAEKLNMEKNLQNEFQILQASSAIQIDDRESRVHAQLREANNKIHELNYSSNIMREELTRLRTIQAKRDNFVKEKEKLEKRVEALERKLLVTQEELLMSKRVSPKLEVDYSELQEFASDSLAERLYGQDIYESKTVERGNNASSLKNHKTLSAPLKSPNKPKKRRLFDPNCLEYLKDLEQPR